MQRFKEIKKWDNKYNNNYNYSICKGIPINIIIFIQTIMVIITVLLCGYDKFKSVQELKSEGGTFFCAPPRRFCAPQFFLTKYWLFFIYIKDPYIFDTFRGVKEL